MGGGAIDPTSEGKPLDADRVNASSSSSGHRKGEREIKLSRSASRSQYSQQWGPEFSQRTPEGTQRPREWNLRSPGSSQRSPVSHQRPSVGQPRLDQAPQFQHQPQWKKKQRQREQSEGAHGNRPMSAVRRTQSASERGAPNHLHQRENWQAAQKTPTGTGPYSQAKAIQMIFKDPRASLPFFKKAILQRDRVDSALKDYAIVLKQLQMHDEAIDAVNTYRDRCPAKAQEGLDNIMIDLYKKTKNTGMLIALLQQKLRDIDNGTAFKGKPTKTARSQGQKFQVDEPTERTRVMGNLGWAYMRINDFVKAEEQYRGALAILPDANKECNLGICLMEQGRYAEAIQRLQNVSEIPDEDSRLGIESHLKSYERAQRMLAEIKAAFEYRQQADVTAALDALRSGSTWRLPEERFGEEEEAPEIQQRQHQFIESLFSDSDDCTNDAEPEARQPCQQQQRQLKQEQQQQQQQQLPELPRWAQNSHLAMDQSNDDRWRRDDAASPQYREQLQTRSLSESNITAIQPALIGWSPPPQRGNYNYSQNSPGQQHEDARWGAWQGGMSPQDAVPYPQSVSPASWQPSLAMSAATPPRPRRSVEAARSRPDVAMQSTMGHGALSRSRPPLPPLEVPDFSCLDYVPNALEAAMADLTMLQAQIDVVSSINVANNRPQESPRLESTPLRNSIWADGGNTYALDDFSPGSSSGGGSDEWATLIAYDLQTKANAFPDSPYMSNKSPENPWGASSGSMPATPDGHRSYKREANSESIGMHGASSRVSGFASSYTSGYGSDSASSSSPSPPMGRRTTGSSRSNGSERKPDTWQMSGEARSTSSAMAASCNATPTRNQRPGRSSSFPDAATGRSSESAASRGAPAAGHVVNGGGLDAVFVSGGIVLPDELNWEQLL